MIDKVLGDEVVRLQQASADGRIGAMFTACEVMFDPLIVII